MHEEHKAKVKVKLFLCLIKHHALRAGLSGFYGSILAGAGNFSLHHHVQNGSGAHPTSYPRVTMGSFPGIKAAEA
jgi:hypothetical protein